ncbi:MAG: hypothetical protein P1V35_11985 [Planctomycetota bacterium]|nr:hypothetical protein [Planctomycetota bacterium]
MNRFAHLLVLSSPFALVAAAQAQASDLKVIYSTVNGHPTASIAGIPNAEINYLDRSAISPSGNHWAITLRLSTGSGVTTEVLVLDGSLLLQGDIQLPFLPSGRTIEYFDTQLGVSNIGEVAWTGDLDGDSATDDVAGYYDGQGVHTILAQEGNPITWGPAGWIFDEIESAGLGPTGMTYELNSIDGGPTTNDDEVLVAGNSIFLREDVHTPSGQMSLPVQPWQHFEHFRTHGSASHHLVSGELMGGASTDRVVVLDGQVIAQSGFQIPAGLATDIIDSFGFTTLGPSGGWMYSAILANGSYATVHNGNVVARDGAPILPGASESYVGPASGLSCNSWGEYVIMGTTSAPVSSNSVLVFNGQEVVARSGDPVDLDGNGIFDDDAFVTRFLAGGCTLSNDRRIYHSAVLQNGLGLPLGEYFGYVQVDDGRVGTTFCEPANTNSTGGSTTLRGYVGGGGSSGLHLEVFNGPSTHLGYFLVGTGVDPIGLPISAGKLCLSTLPGNLMGRYNIAGSNLAGVGRFGSDGILHNLTSTSTSGTGYDVPVELPTIGGTIMAGDTWNFQLWHREPAGESNFSNGLSVTF